MLPISFHLTITLLVIAFLLIVAGIYMLFIPDPVSGTSSFTLRKDLV